MTTTKTPKFLCVLYDILYTESSSILAWSPCGTYVQIYDVTRFERDVLPRYFKHSKFASFQRQLNNFGFRKWTKTRAGGVCTFSHDTLTRCAPHELAQLVVRCGVVSPHTKVGAGKRSRTDSETTDSSSGSSTDCDERDWIETKKTKTVDDDVVDEMNSLLDLLDGGFCLDDGDIADDLDFLAISSDSDDQLNWILPDLYDESNLLDELLEATPTLDIDIAIYACLSV